MFVGLGIQHAMYVHLIVISTLSHKRHDFFKENVIEHKIRVLIFSTNFVLTVLIQTTAERDMIKKYILVFI